MSLLNLENNSEFLQELISWRHELHRYPELMYELPRTASFVANKLRQFGFDEVIEGIAKSGVIGVLHGRTGPAKSRQHRILLRSDMDALPIEERASLGYRSKFPGNMHACGHDGHMVMLLGAAKLLADGRDFEGSIVFCFQPAEEGGAGAQAMIDAGLLEKYPVQSAFGLHNWPGMPVGSFGIAPRAMMAGADALLITIEGTGSHAAQPHLGRDPIAAAGYLITLLQTIVSRKLDPLDPAVVSITSIHGGEAWNVIPDKVQMRCNIRSFSEGVAATIGNEIQSLCLQTANGFGVNIEAVLPEGCIPYPATINHPAQVDIAVDAAKAATDAGLVNADMKPTMAAEDFGFLLRKVPGAFMFIGNGDSASLHSSEYDFDDKAIPFGVAYWRNLVKKVLV